MGGVAAKGCPVGVAALPTGGGPRARGNPAYVHGTPPLPHLLLPSCSLVVVVGFVAVFIVCL